jgi:DNA polymerase
MTGVCDDCSEKVRQLLALNDTIQQCQECALGKTATHKVHGRGFPTARILFIGEAPGKNEDLQGMPFVGAAGQVLDSLLNKYHFPIDSYFITNCICCRPPGNRSPTEIETLACRKYLEQTIKLINPKVIVTLGQTATTLVFDMYNVTRPMDMVRTHGMTCYTNNLILLPTYHPAAALYNRTLIDSLDSDFEILHNIYKGFKR